METFLGQMNDSQLYGLHQLFKYNKRQGKLYPFKLFYSITRQKSDAKRVTFSPLQFVTVFNGYMSRMSTQRAKNTFSCWDTS